MDGMQTSPDIIKVRSRSFCSLGFNTKSWTKNARPRPCIDSCVNFPDHAFSLGEDRSTELPDELLAVCYSANSH